MKRAKFIAIIAITFCVLRSYSANYYLRSNTGQPWGVNNNENAMTGVFGAGWVQGFYETIAPATLFAAANCFIFMEGGDGNATAFNTFITANMVAMQNWVNAGGRLILNAAPNVGANINYGFGGVLLNYNGGTSLAWNGNASAGQAGHPIFTTPNLPAGTAYTGNYFAHAWISGGGTTSLINDIPGPSLTEKVWGAGRVMFGGMTTDNWQSPSPNSQNLRKNIIKYMSCAVLPIEMVSFSGKQSGRKNILDWTTATEIDNAYFTIERSTDAGNFTEVARVPGAGDSYTMKNYNYTDENPLSGTMYYRLKQTDKNGHFSYSKLVYINQSAKVNSVQFIDIRPNPASSNLYVDVTSSENIPITTEIKDIYGKTVLQYSSTTVLGSNSFDVPVESLSNGFYFVNISADNCVILNTKFIKN